MTWTTQNAVPAHPIVIANAAQSATVIDLSILDSSQAVRATVCHRAELPICASSRGHGRVARFDLPCPMREQGWGPIHRHSEASVGHYRAACAARIDGL
jgi:hypothetical protein